MFLSPIASAMLAVALYSAMFLFSVCVYIYAYKKIENYAGHAICLTAIVLTGTLLAYMITLADSVMEWQLATFM